MFAARHATAPNFYLLLAADASTQFKRTMKQVVLFCLAAILLVGPSSCEDKGDGFDLNKWMADTDKVKQFIDCVTADSPDKCSEEDLVWKEIILSKCEQCTAEQKEMYDKGFSLFAEKYPDWAKDLKDKESK